MRERSIVAQRQVCDRIVHAGGVGNVEITKLMVKNVNMFHSRDKDDLKRKKRRKVKGRRRESTETISCPKNQGLDGEKGKI